MDKSLNDNTHNFQQPTKKVADSSIGERVAGVANVVHGAGEVLRGTVLDLTDCRKGTGKDIVAEGKAEFERGSNKLGFAHKLATTSTGAASDTERAGPYNTTGVSTMDASDTRRDADPGRRTEKGTVPTTMDGGSARPEYTDEKRPTPQATSPGPQAPRAEGAQYTEEGHKTSGTAQERTSDDTANEQDPTSAGPREHSDGANVPD
ncbi:hypothetical protein EI94DRAFT_1757198 [Lactarius quietus]|nr:hypothetical protein EI94DRAFT_1757198 [Lactarius quietus]